MSEALTDAARLIEAGRYDQALKLLAPLTDARRHALLGAAWLGRRKAAPALHHLKLALAERPGDVEALLALGKSMLIGLDAPAAVALLEALERRAPELPGLDETLASAYRRDALFEQAVAVADRAARPGPSLLYERAFSLMMLGRAEDSLAGFDRLLALDPAHAAGWFWSHAPALDQRGWPEAERRLLQAAAIPGANRKYAGYLAAYDLLRDAPAPRPCPIAFRHLADGAAAVRQFCREPPRLFGVPAHLLAWSLRQADRDGMVCEFGVRRGNSLRQLAAATDQTLHGFDSFAGLPEGWARAPAGVLTTAGSLPAVPANVRLHPGWFEDSLPPFLAAHGEKLRFANIDCDIYSSTRTVLWALAERLQPGSVLVFDELIGNRSWRQDEYRALGEFAEHFRRRFEGLAVNLSGKQVAIRLF
jgi:tetratricopeptide (TPR) repeat protein